MKVIVIKGERFVECDACGYNNKEGRLSHFGTCLRCGKTLDPKAKFFYEMNKKIKIRRGRKNEKSNSYQCQSKLTGNI